MICLIVDIISLNFVYRENLHLADDEFWVVSLVYMFCILHSVKQTRNAGWFGIHHMTVFSAKMKDAAKNVFLKLI